MFVKYAFTTLQLINKTMTPLTRHTLPLLWFYYTLSPLWFCYTLPLLEILKFPRYGN